MYPKSTILSEINQTHRLKYHTVSLVCKTQSINIERNGAQTSGSRKNLFIWEGDHEMGEKEIERKKELKGKMEIEGREIGL